MNDRTDLAGRAESMPEKHREIPAVSPFVDIYESNDEILLRADMPGVGKKDITINFNNGKLSLGGVRKIEVAGAAQWEEFGDVEFARTFSVPQTIEVDKISARLKDGVLSLQLPKSEKSKPRQIEITTV